MRVISGKNRGTKLYTLDGLETRPTLDRVKESLFNIINFDIPNCNFLDLFAGSGAIGIEAASRGAKKVVMCEKSIDAIKIINKNIEKTKLKEIIKVHHEDFEKCINNLEDKFDIIFLDPPYKTDYVFKAIKKILEKKIYKEDTIIVIETDIEQDIENSLIKLEIEEYDKKKYGRASILFYRIKR